MKLESHKLAETDVKMRGPNSPATLSTYIIVTGSASHFEIKQQDRGSTGKVPGTTGSTDGPLKYAMEEELWKVDERIERKIKIRNH